MLEHLAKNMEYMFVKSMFYFKVLDRPDVRQAGAQRPREIPFFT